MIDEGYRCWDDCPEVDTCELVLSFMQLIDAMIKDIQHLNAETIRARYELSRILDPDKEWITTVDILSNLDIPHYDNLAYQEFIFKCYDGGNPLSFKEYIDSMVRLANGIDDSNY